MQDRKLLGALGEELASGILYSEGYRILERNFRSYAGEVDIICDRGNEIDFVEVKTRTGDLYGSPFQAVGRKKLETIRKVADYYIMKTRCGKDPRIKVIGIDVREEYFDQ